MLMDNGCRGSLRHAHPASRTAGTPRPAVRWQPLPLERL